MTRVLKQEANGSRSSRPANIITSSWPTYLFGEDVDVARAVREMHSQKAEIVMVTKDGKPVGIVTDSDVLDKVVIKGEDSDQILLKSIASSPVVTLSANGTVRQALELMR